MVRRSILVGLRELHAQQQRASARNDATFLFKHLPQLIGQLERVQAEGFAPVLLGYLANMTLAHARERNRTVDGFAQGNRAAAYAREVHALAPQTICEVGFNFGYSALLFALSSERSRIISIDLMLPQESWKFKAIAFLQAIGVWRRITLLIGNSSHVVVDSVVGDDSPALRGRIIDSSGAVRPQEAGQPSLFSVALRSAGALCDFVHVDGSHEGDQAWIDLRQLHEVGRAHGARILVDDAGDCVYCAGAERAWHRALAEGRLRSGECHWTQIAGRRCTGRDEGHRFCIGTLA